VRDIACGVGSGTGRTSRLSIKNSLSEREFLRAASARAAAFRSEFIDNLLVRNHFIIVMIRWTGLAPCEFELPFPGSLTFTFLGSGERTPDPNPPRKNAGIVRGYLAHKKHQPP